MTTTTQCPHCGDVFDDATLEGHMRRLVRSSTPRELVEWLLSWAYEYNGR